MKKPKHTDTHTRNRVSTNLLAQVQLLRPHECNAVLILVVAFNYDFQMYCHSIDVSMAKLNKMLYFTLAYNFLPCAMNSFHKIIT